ncbi:hypothetical protein IC229_13050 [Spirosoma sp. BT702]|uniref:DUF1565 domain-containing protein n=1 Tax=Spirosoma profusum TaxID=2771354 RepID=A0A926Y393_9BACT|nr:hypothetical protein [Spirosoma profusum]MBD2701571.1 hypothetical protein [Spirosoma profusum]
MYSALRFLTFGLLFLMSQLSQAQIIYVTPAGAGNQSGSSWANALPGTSLQSRLATATSGTFLVGAGEYTPAAVSDPTKSFFIPSGVQVYGGYVAGTTNRITTPSGTTFSGDIGSPGLVSDNSYHVVMFRNASANTRLEGVVITGGFAEAAAPNGQGGGIYNDGSGSGNQSNPNLANVLLHANTSTNGVVFGNNGANTFYTPSGSTLTVRVTPCWKRV